MDTREQSIRNHRRWFPLYHFVATPILGVATVMATMDVIRAPGRGTILVVLLCWGVLLAVLAVRVMALTVQDRLIRLEETLRMQRILPDDLQAVIPTLRRRHFIALRFASDEELPDLVRRVAAGELTDQQSIKVAITTWRPDHFRA
jgi:hypothetical protein